MMGSGKYSFGITCHGFCVRKRKNIEVCQISKCFLFPWWDDFKTRKASELPVPGLNGGEERFALTVLVSADYANLIKSKTITHLGLQHCKHHHLNNNWAFAPS